MKIRVLDWDAAAAEIANGATILDLRDATLFGRGHLVGSIHIKAKSPNFAERVRRFTQATKPILFVADHLDEADGQPASLLESDPWPESPQLRIRNRRTP